MSVAIRFEDEGYSGLVAEGTYLWEAAKRLGVHLPADCNGRGECDACAVVIVEGAELLFAATDAEQKILGAERLAKGQRLACQTKLEQPGEVVVRPAPTVEGAEQQKYRKRFRDLPLNQQVSSLIELEANVVSEALNTFRGKYVSFLGQLMNLTPPKSSANQRDEDEGNAPAANKQKAHDAATAKRKRKTS
jgi:ferredoxin